jgi:uncharacterized membrane protein YeaQ/YmgE (transglycosylase-associated protein family)
MEPVHRRCETGGQRRRIKVGGGFTVSILVWIILGLIAGWVASILVGGGYGLIGDIIVGVIGAFVGGWLGSMFLGLDVTGLNPTSILLAIGGSIIVLLIFHAVSSGRSRA